MAAALPCAFGRYTLLAELGHGGMAEIFLARAVGAHGFERRFVIKRMHAHLSQDPQFTRMFIREARLSARLVHANVVPVFDFGETDGHLYLAMEYVDGVDLRPILKGLRQRSEALPVEIACFVAIEILRGLDYAHRQVDDEGNAIGLVHRDVSPSNVLVSREGEIKVCDFGIALIASDHMTAAGTLKGKFAYMAPEQARGLPIDRRTDVFGVALILWEMLAGRRLYVAPDDVQTLILAQQAQHPAPPVDRAPEGALLGSILSHALAASPRDRTPTAAAFADDLQDYASRAGVVATSSRLAAFLRARCAIELERRDRRVHGEIDDGGDSIGSVPSTFTSLPALPKDWASDAPEIELDLGEAESETGVVPPPGRTAPISGAAPLWPAPSAPGDPPRGAPARPDVVVDPTRVLSDPLLALLVQRGMVTAAQGAVAIGHARRWACRVSAAILAHRFVSESELAHVLADLHRLPTVDLASLEISPRVFRRIPRALAERLDVLAFDAAPGPRGALSVALADPEVLVSQRDIEFAAGAPIRPHVARYSAVTAAIRTLWGGEKASVPALFPPGVSEPLDHEGEMVIERLDGESMVNTAVDESLELDAPLPRPRK